jgi:hypothetical protein
MQAAIKSRQDPVQLDWDLIPILMKSTLESAVVFGFEEFLYRG